MKNCPNRENLQYKNTDGVRSATAVFEDFISTKRSEGKSDYTLTTTGIISAFLQNQSVATVI